MAAGRRRGRSAVFDLPRVIGHRGAAGIAPENTIAALAAARHAGARWVEFDVRLTADGVPVVIHDATLERVAGIPARVSRTPFARLQALDAGAWFAPRFRGQRVPTLDETLIACASLQLGANVELKWCGARSPALAHAVAEALRPAMGAPVLVSSFRPGLLAALRRAAPDVPRGLLMSRPRPGWRQMLARLGCASVHVGARALDETAIVRLKAAGLKLVVYTVNDAAQAARLVAAGVDSVITDRPDLLVPALA